MQLIGLAYISQLYKAIIKKISTLKKNLFIWLCRVAHGILVP